MDKPTGGRQKGQALVELALTLPLILLLVLGAMDFGRVYHTKIVITNAAREGANYLAYYPEEPNTSLVVIKEYASNAGVVLNDGDVLIENYDTPLSITVTKTIDDLIFNGFLTAVGILDGPLTITSKVSMETLVPVD